MNIYSTITVAIICMTVLQLARKGGKGRSRAIPRGTKGQRKNGREKKPIPPPSEPLPMD